MLFEESTPPENLEALKVVRDKSPMAISAGERQDRTNYDRGAFASVILLSDVL